ncbi:MAG: glycosyltransferase family 1 protein [bacterium]|nr:glycosyltransferase family 1 protein [bacterium]
MDKDIRKSRIGIDARFYGPLGKGLGRYVQEIVDRVIRLQAANEPEIEFVIFLSPGNYEEYVCPNSNVRKVLVPQRWYSWREQVIFPIILRREKLSLIHFPHFNVPLLTPSPFIVTIHDLILTKFPSRRASMLPPLLYWIKQAAYRLVVRTAVRRAKAIIAVSEFTKKDIIEQFSASPAKIFITYEGVVDFNRTENIEEKGASILGEYGISRPYLLYVGNAYPHKNLSRLLSSYLQVRKILPDLSLVMVGKNDYFYQRVRAEAQQLTLAVVMNGQGKIIFPGYVPDEELGNLYRNALLYVFPSLYEGFGLPPLEAMSCSCPVASSNQASLPEILGEAATYFDPYDVSNMSAIISDLAVDEKRREEMISAGREHIKKFSWQRCAEQTLAIYLQIISHNAKR